MISCYCLFDLTLGCYFVLSFFFIYPATTEIYTYGHTLSLHDALPISRAGQRDQLHGVDVGRAGVAGNLPRDLRLAVEILLVAHPLEDLERGFLRHRARFALRHPQLLGIESYLGIARLEVLHDGLQRRSGELRITRRGVARRVGPRRAPIGKARGGEEV